VYIERLAVMTYYNDYQSLFKRVSLGEIRTGTRGGFGKDAVRHSVSCAVLEGGESAICIGGYTAFTSLPSTLDTRSHICPETWFNNCHIE
jgi:hypothetical protein